MPHSRQPPEPKSLSEGAVLSPDDAFDHALSFARAGQFDDALTLCRQLLELRVDQPQVVRLIGELCQAKGDSRLAEIAHAAFKGFTDSLDSGAGLEENLVNTGTLAWRLRWAETAVKAFRQALDINPRSAASYNLGVVYGELQEWELALEPLKLSVRHNPSNADAQYLLGNALSRTGRLEEATQAYRSAVSERPDFAAAFRQLVEMPGFSVADGDLKALNAIIDRADGTAEDKTAALFARSRVHEKLGSLDAGFADLVRGNTLWRETLEFDIAAHENLVERIISTFSADVLERRLGTGAPSSRPIFVIGMPRSGTTLVETILATHSDVHGAGKLQDFPSIVEKHAASAGNRTGYPKAVETFGDDTLYGIANDYLAVLARHSPTAPRVTDKLPANFLFAGLIALVFPNAKLVHCVRDPVDTCLSCYRTLFPQGLEFSYDLGELGAYYVAYRRLMAHWRRVIGDRMIDLPYEDLLNDQVGQTRRLLEFCGLDWQDACLEFNRTKRQILTASVSQVRQPIYRSSVGRWHRYRDRLGPLLDALGPLAGT